MDRPTRAYFEPRFGTDFSDVRLHTGPAADRAAHSVCARAFTVGRDIAFASHQYAPSTPQGRRLLAHELTHVVQQRGGVARAPRVQRVVSPDYLIDDPFTRRPQRGAPLRVFFARGSAAIPPREQPKVDAFKTGPSSSVPLTLLGLATEDELAVTPSLPLDRATAVDTALGTPLPIPFVTLRHTGARVVTPGTLANTQERPNVAFNRAVEVRRPGEVSLSPDTPIASPLPCAAPFETAFQAAKTMAFDWIDTTRPEVQARPITGSIAASLDRFFGNHRPETARRVDHNLRLIRAEVASLALAANHDCADVNLPGCVGALAFNSGGRMTICSGYLTHTAENQARNIVHEAGHSTAGLRIRGLANRPRTSDFAYRSERWITFIGRMAPDDALSNSDSYSMFLMTRRVPAAVTPGLLPTSDPAPTGFANVADEEKAQRAVARAQLWLRQASFAARDLHSRLRVDVRTGNPVPPDLGDPRRMDRILTQLRARFPPILSGANVTGDDLLMIAGVLDRYEDMEDLIGLPVAISLGAATTLTLTGVVPTGSLALTVTAGFLAAAERARARTIVDKVIELMPVARISVAMRPNYGGFAEFVRDLTQ